MEVETFINKSSIVKRCCSLIIGTLYWKRRKSIEILTNYTVDEDFSFFWKRPMSDFLRARNVARAVPKVLAFVFCEMEPISTQVCTYFYFLLMKLLLRRFLLFLLKKAEAYFTLCNDLMLCFYGL